MIIIGAKFNNAAPLEKALIAAFKKWAKEDINEAHWDDQFKNMGRWDYDNDTKRKELAKWLAVLVIFTTMAFCMKVE